MNRGERSLPDDPALGRYVFTHIPKTGGTSLSEAVAAKIGQDQVRRDTKFPLSDGYLKRNFKCIAASMTYRAFPERIVVGHFLTGKYARFNGFRFVPRSGHTYITFLREPLQRAISHFHFWRRIDGAGNKAWEKMIRENWTLEDFLLSRYFANLQSQFLYRFALENFNFVGLTEQYEKSLKILGERFALFRDLPILRCNVNPQIDTLSDLSPAVRSRFVALNRRDYRIYNQAVSWLAESIGGPR
jgi:hypothetical protein